MKHHSIWIKVHVANCTETTQIINRSQIDQVDWFIIQEPNHPEGWYVQDTVYMLDTNHKELGWVLQGPRLLTARSYHLSFILGVQLYVGCGRNQDSNKISDLEVMDLINTHNWTRVTEQYPLKVNITPPMLVLEKISVSI